MRLLDLHLLAFGPFEGASIDLSSGNQGLHVIYGPNEAGKSSALRALRQALFGIPVRTMDNFRHPHTKMRIGASVRHSDGKTLAFIRRKGNKNTLRATDDETIIDDAILERFFKGIDADLFSTMFGIDHSDLVNGGREIISGGGNLGHIIFAAGSGITRLRKVQAELREKADALFKATGKLPRINETLFRIKENRKKLKDTQLASGEWARHDQALESAIENKKKAEQKLSHARSQKNRLERIKEALPVIARRRDILENLKQYTSAVLLPENFGAQRRDHLSNLKIAQNDQAQSAANILSIENEIRQMRISKRILENAEAIENIFVDLGGIGKAARDRLQLRTRTDVLRSEARQILKDLRNDLTIDEADKLRLSKKDTLYIQELGSRYERITTLIDSTREKIPGLAHQVGSISSKLSSLKKSRPVSELILAVDQAAEYASIEKKCIEEFSEYRLAEKSLAIELDRQTFWSGSLEALERLKIPSAETIEVFETDFEAVERLVERLEKEIRKLQADLSRTVKNSEELALHFAIPTESDLAAARKKRDDTWRSLTPKINQSNDPSIQTDRVGQHLQQSLLQSEDLFSEYEACVVQADELSDRLRREADRVATLAKLMAEKSDIDKKLANLKDELSAAKNKQQDILFAWSRQWAPAGISPASPKEMRAWAALKKELSIRFADISNRKARTVSNQKAIDNLRQKISMILASLSEPAAADSETLSDLIKRCRQIIETEKSLSIRRESLENEKSQKEELLAELNIRAQVNEKELLNWQQQWEMAVSRLGLDANSLPSHAGAFIEDLKSLFDKLKEAEVLQKRINGIDRDASAFNNSVQDLVHIAALDLAGQPAEFCAAEMNRRLKETRTAFSKVQTLESQILKEKQRIRQSEKTIKDIEAFLKTMCEEAGCTDYKDLPEAENRSARRRELESELDTIEKQLVKLSAGADISDFVEDALSAEPDSIDLEIERITERIDLYSKEKSELDQTIGSERTELSKMDGSARAAALAEDTQTLLGGLEESIEDFARLKIASAVLNLAIERFRDKHQSPLLQRAGTFFSQITDGSFEGIRAEFDDSGNPVIAGVRKNGNGIVSVDGMSEGTADQLYLSLRLAGLEEYLEKNEPMPFIVDDILIQFDDMRAIAALKALARLSEKTQVIFLTHHRHLLDLAEKHIDPSILIRHNLNE